MSVTNEFYLYDKGVFMHTVRGVFDGQNVMAIDPIPVRRKCDVVITFLEYSVAPKKNI